MSGGRDDLLPKDPGQRRRAIDCLIALVARYLERQPDWAEQQDPRFLQWLARRHEVRGDDDELWTREEAAAVAQHIEARLRAAQAPVERLNRPPELRSPARAGSVAYGLEHAGEGHAPYLDLAAAAGSGRALWDMECEHCVVLPDGLPRGRYLALGVAGDSMEPLLHSGDVVLVRLGTGLTRGAVIVARLADDMYVIKQVGRATQALLELRSLNDAYAPLHVARAAQTVLGTVVLRWCAHAGEARPRRA